MIKEKVEQIVNDLWDSIKLLNIQLSRVFEEQDWIRKKIFERIMVIYYRYIVINFEK